MLALMRVATNMVCLHSNRAVPKTQASGTLLWQTCFFWAECGHWSRDAVDHFKHGLMDHTARVLEDCDPESNVGWEGPDQELSGEKNISKCVLVIFDKDCCCLLPWSITSA